MKYEYKKVHIIMYGRVWNMLYQTQATQQTPAYIIYLLDVSASMNQMMDAGGEKKKN